MDNFDKFVISAILLALLVCIMMVSFWVNNLENRIESLERASMEIVHVDPEIIK